MRYVVTGKPSDGPIARYINRPISTRITRLIIRITDKVTPNQITVIAFALGIFSGLAYLISSPIIAGILVQFSSIFDGVDGEIARALHKESKFGAFVDSILDRLVDGCVLICISIYLLRTSSINIEILMLVALLALLGNVLVSYVRGKMEQFFGEAMKQVKQTNIATRDVRLFLIFLGSVLGYIFETLVLLVILTYLQVIIKIVKSCKIYNEFYRKENRNRH